jgi:hypothetical protein
MPAGDAESCVRRNGATFATRLHLNLLTAILASLLERFRGRRQIHLSNSIEISIQVIQRAAHLCGIKAGGTYGRD